MCLGLLMLLQIVIPSFVFCICQFAVCRIPGNVQLIGRRIYQQALSLAKLISLYVCYIGMHVHPYHWKDITAWMLLRFPCEQLEKTVFIHL